MPEHTKPDWEGEKLHDEIEQVILYIQNFLKERERKEPLFGPTTGSAWLGITEEERKSYYQIINTGKSKYFRETMSLFKSQYLTRIEKIKEELKRRGIENEEFDKEFEYVVNTIGIERLLSKLAEMKARI